MRKTMSLIALLAAAVPANATEILPGARIAFALRDGASGFGASLSWAVA